MRATDLIIKKRDGLSMTAEEIRWLVDGYTRGEIPDYQMAAWAMAVLLNGMDDAETTELTLASAESGELLDLSSAVPFAVDKHSTGGVGDKVTLAAEPIVSACGLPVGKMSGRGLGFSGGTLDKMESIPGFRTDLTTRAFLDQLARLGLVLAGQTADLAPFDGKLYALRDVTGTVPSIPLIAASVMSKKIAAGAQAIVLDVKVGLGAFMPTLEQASALARQMTAIGHRSGRRTTALISDMNQPLGCAVGNALEVREAIQTLRGGGPADFREHCLEVAAHMLVLGEKYPSLPLARAAAETAVSSGRAFEKFRALVEAQGGDPACVDDPSRLPAAPVIETAIAPRAGWLGRVHAGEVGQTSVELGAGRARKGDPINPAVGIEVHHKVGDRVEEGTLLFTIHAADADACAVAKARLLGAVTLSDEPVEPLPLFYEVIAAAE
jgi:pyrimidine-nucleoside phosphorylase